MSGVDTVMLGSDYLTALRFIAFAEAQHYFPQYLTSDLGSLESDGLLAQAGKSLDGAIGFSDSATSTSGGESPQAKACRENYNENTNTENVPAGAQSVLGIICSSFDLFVRAATDAGHDLNPRSFVQAVEAVGAFDKESAVLPGTFGPGKTDYSDELAPVRWSSASKSYSVDGDPVSVDQ